MKKRNIELGFCEVKGNFKKMLMDTPPAGERVGMRGDSSPVIFVKVSTKGSAA